MTDGSTRPPAPLSVARVMQVLDALSLADEPATLAQLSRTLGVPKSSLVGLLRGLCDTDFVTHTNGAYQLGGAAFDLAGAIVNARRRLHVSSDIRAGMVELNARAGDTVLFGVLAGGDDTTLTYVDIVESRNAIRVTVNVGDKRPLYCTAGGRMLLAARSDEAVRRYLDLANIEQRTPHTETSKASLLEAIRQARADEVACVRDEVVDGVGGIAAVVRDASGAALGTLIVAAPTKYRAAGDADLIALVRDSAREISRRLGYRDLPARA